MCIETPGRYCVSQMQTILKCRQTWFQSERRKWTHGGQRFTEYPFLNSAIALSSIKKSYATYLSFLHKKTVIVSIPLYLPTFQEKMLRKKKSWHWAPFSSLPPSCQWPFSCTSPYFPGDWSHSLFISVLLPHCCGLRTLFISSVNSAQRRRCSHGNIHLSDWAIVYHANSRWGQLLSLLHMSNLHLPDHNLIHAIF